VNAKARKLKGDYPEFCGKTVRRITAANDEGWKVVAIDFENGDSLSFHLHLTLTMKPERYRVRDGDVVLLVHRYPHVREKL